MQKEFSFNYEILHNINELSDEEKALLQQARDNTRNAYAPYSHFNVSAVALLGNGKIICATNQENASYPVGICAERTLLSAVSSLQSDAVIKTIAISYHNLDGESNKPVSPCGLCRQSLLEYEHRFNCSLRIIMSGMEGDILVIEGVQQLLPFSFSSGDMSL